MNIFKKIIEANKYLKAIQEAKDFNNSNHLTEDTKKDIAILKETAERLVNRVPAYVALYTILKKAF